MAPQLSMFQLQSSSFRLPVSNFRGHFLWKLWRILWETYYVNWTRHPQILSDMPVQNLHPSPAPRRACFGVRSVNRRTALRALRHLVNTTTPYPSSTEEGDELPSIVFKEGWGVVGYRLDRIGLRPCGSASRVCGGRLAGRVVQVERRKQKAAAPHSDSGLLTSGPGQTLRCRTNPATALLAVN